MTNSPKADAWIREFQVPWGFQAAGGKNTESLLQSLVSTNGAAVESAARLRTAPLPWYQVVRLAGVDFAVRPGVFRLITSPDDYHFLLSSGWINVPHGSAASVELNLLQYIRNEASLAGDGKIEPIPEGLGVKVAARETVETAAETRQGCAYCLAEDGELAGQDEVKE